MTRIDNDKQQKYAEDSRKRLAKIVETKLRTAFIGDLSFFEEEFGWLWGFRDENPTDDQMQMREKWERVRTRVLNNGNNQLRALLQEIAQYTMTWDRYRMMIPVMTNKETQEG